MKKKQLTAAAILFTMRITIMPIALPFLFSLSVYANKTNAQGLLNKPVSVSVKQVEISQIINIIQEQTGVKFLYSPEAIRSARKVTYTFTNRKLREVMNEVFKPLNIEYKILNEKVLLYATELNDSFDFSSNNTANDGNPASVKVDRSINGIITNEKQETLAGVNIIVKGSTLGTVSDQNGAFKLTVGDNPVTLVISHTGYKTKEIVVAAGTSTINIQLEIGNGALEEVVVVGYGTQKKANLTGAVGYVGGDKIEGRPISNLGAALQGLVPNLNITRPNGAPGQGSTFNIRGTTNLSGTGTPLILVDGVQMDANLINPDNVESVSVLKDAASSAIYGVRAAYGVILITTKNPKRNAPTRVSYSGSYTVTRPTRMPDFMTSLQYITAHREADRNGSISGGSTAGEKYTVMDSTLAAAYLTDPAHNSSVYVDPAFSTTKYRYVGNTNWIDVLYPGWAPLTQHTLSISGGGKTSYAASMGYFKQDGLLKIAHDSYTRYNPTLRINSEVTKWMDVNFKLTLNHADGDKPTPAKHGGLSSGWIPTDLRPTMPVYHPDGHYSGQGNYTNMVALATLNGRTVEKLNDLFLTGGVVIRPIKNVRIVTDYTWNNTSDIYTQEFKEYKEYGVNGIYLQVFPWSTPNRLSEFNYNKEYYSFNSYVDYENTFGGKHYVKALLGYNQEYYHEKYYLASVKNLIDPLNPNINQNSDPTPLVTPDPQYGTVGIPNPIGSNQPFNRDWALTGTFYRLNYAFDNKYLVELNGRYDGTSRFARGRRYTFLPSVSAGWRISEEKFFEGSKKIVSELKLRASYGTLGNQVSSNTNFYPYIAQMSTANLAYILGTTTGVGVNAPPLVSQAFTWEKVTTKDIGIDFGFLQNRLTGSFDGYIRDTKNMLTPGTPLPAVLGTAVPQINAADLRTKGWELNLSWSDRINKDLSYSIGANLSDYTSEITRFDNNPNKLLNTFYVGQKINEIWGYTTEGFYKTDAEAAAQNQAALWGGTWLAGDIKYADLDKNGKIDGGAATVANPGDRKIIGNSTPRYQYGFNLEVNYKGFDFSVFFQGVGKRDIALGGTYFYPFANDEYDVPLKYQLNYWTPSNTNAYYPRLRFGGGGNNQTQTKYLQNAAYLRMKNIALGYNFPASLLRKAGLQRARLYVTGENLLETTKVSEGWDPELLGAQSYPLNRAISFGLQLGL